MSDEGLRLLLRRAAEADPSAAAAVLSALVRGGTLEVGPEDDVASFAVRAERSHVADELELRTWAGLRGARASEAWLVASRAAAAQVLRAPKPRPALVETAAALSRWKPGEHRSAALLVQALYTQGPHFEVLGSYAAEALCRAACVALLSGPLVRREELHAVALAAHHEALAGQHGTLLPSALADLAAVLREGLHGADSATNAADSLVRCLSATAREVGAAETRVAAGAALAAWALRTPNDSLVAWRRAGAESARA